MNGTRAVRRRVGILLAMLLPVFIVLYGMNSVDAQFPKGGGFKPPVMPKMPGAGPNVPKMPGGGPNLVFDWRCSKCGNVVATTNSGLRPNIDSCPRCGVHFINGGKGALTPPPAR